MKTPVSKLFYKKVWLGYIAAILVAAGLGAVHTFRTQGFSVVELVRLGLTVWFMVGLLGYVFERELARSTLWSVAFYIAALSAALQPVVLISTHGLLVAGTAVLLLVAQGPLLYGLWVYQVPQQPWWLDLAAYQNQRLLKEIDLEDKAIELTAVEQAEGQPPKTYAVHLSKIHDVFSVAMNVTVNSHAQAFHNEFWSLDAAMNFIEQQTPLQARDFAHASVNRQYVTSKLEPSLAQ